MTATLLRGAARPRVEVHPPAVDTLGGEAAALAAAAGLELEPWQRDGLDVMLSVRGDGKWACFEYAEICARQNGKTALFKARALAGLFLLGEQTIVWSAHEVKTAMRAWRDLRQLLQRLGTPVNDNLIDVDGILIKVNASNGSEGFERLDTGQEIRMVARSKGSGRGWSVDWLFIDEAFAYDESHQDALMPTLAARPNPQIGIASSPPLSGTTAGPMYALKARAEAGGDETLGYRDWGLEDVLDDVLALPAGERGALLDDRGRWGATNPALGLGRVSEESILRLRRSLSDAGYAREILGCWPRQVDDAAGDVIDPQVWADRADPDSRPGPELVFAVGAGANKRSAAIASSGRREDGRLHVKVTDYRPGTGWVVDRVVELRDRWKPRKIMLDPSSPAGALIADLVNAGVELEYITGREMTQACGALVNDLVEDRVAHCDQQALNDALAQATGKASGDAWKWAPKDQADDICPLQAVTAAAHGFRLYGAQEEVVPWAQWV